MFVGATQMTNFPFCTCECNVVTLIKFRYWPRFQNVVFSFDFMDLLEALYWNAWLQYRISLKLGCI